MNQNSKRIAKNTLYMYLRMFVQLIISLYTTRVVLRQLGVDDYGIYNLAGSVVALFSSLRVLFASSTQRFLNFEMGKNGEESPRLNKIFNMSLNVNLIISIIFVICVECVGIWFFGYKANIDASRLFAAKFIFHLSLASSVCNIITTTFDAEIISHEKMDFYASLSIVESLLRLLIVFLLGIFNYDKLILYGILLFFVSLLVLIINCLYCYFSFRECRIQMLWDRLLAKKMLSFAGWNFLGNTSYSLAHNGINMVLNVFGGAIVNASRGIAYQVQAAVNKFINDISVVLRPYCVKEYAKENYNGFNYVIGILAKLMFFIQCWLVTIIGMNISIILNWWLGTVPPFAVVFTQIILIDSLVRSLSPSIDIVFMSEGRLKEYQIAESILLALPLLASYILLNNEAPYEFVFYLICVFEIINLLVTLVIAGKCTKLDLPKYLNNVLYPCSLPFIVLTISLMFISILKTPIYQATVSFIILLLFLVYMLFFGFSKEERMTLFSIVKSSK